MTTTARVLIVFALYTLLGLVASAQRLPEAWAKSLWLMPDREAWVFADWIPGTWKICARVERGELLGCVTAKELREKAALEQKARKAEP